MIIRRASTPTDQTAHGLPPPILQQGLEQSAFQAFRSQRTAATEFLAHQLVMQGHTNCVAIDRFPWDSLREELAALLEFLEPCVEFGLLQPISDYLDWTASRSSPRAIRPEQLPLVLLSLEDYFRQTMESPCGAYIADLLGTVRAVFVSPKRHRYQPPPPEPGWPEVQELQSSLVEGRQEDALQIMNRCLDAGYGLVEFELKVVQPAMIEVGRLWQQDGLSVAAEHGAAVIARTVMAAGLVRSTPSPANGRSVLLACVEGNDHDLGLHMVADAYRLAGWRVQCLGANVPTQDLVQLAGRTHPDVLGLSVAFAYQLRLIRSVALLLGAADGLPMPVLLAGGIAAIRNARLACSLGADAVATDSVDALAVASQFLD